MTTNDLVRLWKDPDSRVANVGIDHPAGEIVLEHGGSDLVNTEELVSVGCCATYPNCTYPWGCPQTLYGTCGGWTFGCCFPTIAG